MLKSILFAVSALVLSTLALPHSVQAAPILTQEFLNEDGSSFGVLSIDVDNIDEFGTAFEWERFELFDLIFGENLDFFAEFDPSNLLEGATYLSFSVIDITNTYVINGFWDGFDSFISVFSNAENELIFFTDVMYLSDATLVSEPATVFLLFGAMGALLLRRRRA